MVLRGLPVPAEDDRGDKWYFSGKYIEENSPSRRDGIDLKKEIYFRKSYCSFIQELGMRLKVPQVTIATAMIFCHRFFLRQSHGKHDRKTIATVCVFLASKAEETPRALRNVVVLSYEIIHKKDHETVQRIFRQEGVYEEQKELILRGEKLVLETLDFDLSVNHPYKPLVEAIRKFKLADSSALAQVAWNFVNDGLRTSLCLRMRPQQIAAAAIFLAAKFLKLKLPSDGQKAWWQEFAVTPIQLEEISNQMLELYDQNRAPRASQAKAGQAEIRPPPQFLPHGENGCNGSRPVSSSPFIYQANANTHLGPPRASERHETPKCKPDGEINKQPEQGQLIPHQNASMIDIEPKRKKEQENVGGKRMETLPQKDVNAVSQPPLEVVKKRIERKVRAALEKRRKLGPNSSQKRVFVDEDELIEMQLESGIVL